MLIFFTCELDVLNEIIILQGLIKFVFVLQYVNCAKVPLHNTIASRKSV